MFSSYDSPAIGVQYGERFVLGRPQTSDMPLSFGDARTPMMGRWASSRLAILYALAIGAVT
ncbi:hypothetical protein GGD56_000698 [Rhizobium mongolense]|uniref:Uncharacterized protein n=2 Tax=Rhizobium mongolense TaxID=57676 RepID=A0ABR6IGU5_9HYPH|nr:hypothetical protein [Rhizobium mongolense]TVZ74097.1 hypothetical protein BCL32_2408 [Rhizobium mongolense USDA 1844]